MKISAKKKNEILSAISQVFNEVVSEYECYDSPPEMWTDDEKELWDVLTELSDKTKKNINKILNGEQ